MKKYYIMAIDKGNNKAMNNLGVYYYYENNYDLMKKYYLMAIKNGNNDATNNLSKFLKSDINKLYEDYEVYYPYLKKLDINKNDENNIEKLYLEDLEKKVSILQLPHDIKSLLMSY